jgi:hypothetical protein
MLPGRKAECWCQFLALCRGQFYIFVYPSPAYAVFIPVISANKSFEISWQILQPPSLVGQMKSPLITRISSDRDPLTFFTHRTMGLLLHFDFYLVWRHELISFSIALLFTGRLTIGRRTISLGLVWQWASNYHHFWNLLPHSWSGSLIFPFQLYDTGQQFLCAIVVHLFLTWSFQIDWSIQSCG